jgi:riboflavin transporter FmnP
MGGSRKQTLSYWAWLAIGLPVGALSSRIGDLYLWLIGFSFSTTENFLVSLVVMVVAMHVVFSLATYIVLLPIWASRELSIDGRLLKWLAMCLGMLVGGVATLIFEAVRS